MRRSERNSVMSISCVVAVEKRDKICESHVDTTCSVQLRLRWVGKHGVCAHRASDRLSGTSWENCTRVFHPSRAPCMRRVAEDDQILSLRYALAQPNATCLEN